MNLAAYQVFALAAATHFLLSWIDPCPDYRADKLANLVCSSDHRSWDDAGGKLLLTPLGVRFRAWQIVERVVQPLRRQLVAYRDLDTLTVWCGANGWHAEFLGRSSTDIGTRLHGKLRSTRVIGALVRVIFSVFEGCLNGFSMCRGLVAYRQPVDLYRAIWRREPESNRPTRICNPVHNRFAIAPLPKQPAILVFPDEECNSSAKVFCAKWADGVIRTASERSLPRAVAAY